MADRSEARTGDIRYVAGLFDEFISRRLAFASVEVVELSFIRLNLAVEEYRPPQGASPVARDYCIAALNHTLRIAEASYTQYLGELELLRGGLDSGSVS